MLTMQKSLREEFSELTTSLSDEMRSAISNWWLAKISSLLQEKRRQIEGMMKVLPKDPLDITPREQMKQVVQPIHRPYISNEESYNQGVQDSLALLTNEEGNENASSD